MKCILVTGSSGLVGTALCSALEARGVHVRGFDLRAQKTSEKGDVRNRERVRAAMHDVDGVVHLAAVSRVIWGERDPDLCWATNVQGLKHVLDALQRSPKKPWLIFASSREVYGQPESLPAAESSPLSPVNVYGRSKVEGECLVNEIQREGSRACIVRLSNVYGSIHDHSDRVVPAFARKAVLGEALRVEGAEHTFDFTHIDDTTRGLVRLAEHLMRGGETLPPLHFLTGVPTTLGQLAQMASDIAGKGSPIEHAPPRTFDVARFYGCPDRAKSLLDFKACVGIKEGLTRLIQDFAACNEGRGA